MDLLYSYISTFPMTCHSRDSIMCTLCSCTVTLLRELSTLRALRHRNILTVNEVFVSDGTLHLVCPLFRSDLHHYILQFEAGPNASWVPPNTCKHIFRQQMSALAHCHARRIIHLDLKPANILMGATSENITVADWGLSRIAPPDQCEPASSQEALGASRTRASRTPSVPPDLTIFSGLNHFQVHEPASEYTGPPQPTRARLRQNQIKLARPVPEAHQDHNDQPKDQRT